MVPQISQSQGTKQDIHAYNPQIKHTRTNGRTQSNLNLENLEIDQVHPYPNICEN